MPSYPRHLAEMNDETMELEFIALDKKEEIAIVEAKAPGRRRSPVSAN